MAMIGCGTATFTDPDDYRASVPGAAIDLVLTGSDRFRARVTWVNMRRLNLVRLEESVARVAAVSLAPTRLFVSFPLNRDPGPVWNGKTLRRGEMVLHRRGEHFHQRTAGPCRWGLTSLAPGDFTTYSQALLGAVSAPPHVTQILRPSPRPIDEFLRLHHQACRLAQTNPDIAAHLEVARALEQGLIHALINCIAPGQPRSPSSTRLRHADIMARLEQVLAAHDDKPLPVAKLCAAIGVPERTLRACCADLMGMSPVRYARLRRLNLVRSALLRANPNAANVTTVARQYGFSELGRFAAAYRAVFGEAPSETLRRTGLLLSKAAEIA
jgi:AraC-like DNA-binding protein